MASRDRSNTNYYFIVILILVILFAKFWYQFLFNLVFIGYNVFNEMRLGVVFATVIWRLVMYPLRLVGNYMSKEEKKIDKQHEKILAIKDPVKRKELSRTWMQKNRYVLMFLWFNFCFLVMNAAMAGLIFLNEFTSERIASTLYPFVSEPALPLETTGWIPLVGMVDLTQINQKLNFISAIGVAIVGLAEIIIHKKNSRRELIMLLIIFPLGAFLITSQVPSGFEFAMAVLEALTIVFIFLERIVGNIYKNIKESDSLSEKESVFSQIKAPSNP